MAEKKDFYELLGVARDADQKTIKRAFLKLARKLHPDVSDDPHAEEKFKEVNEAYSVLSDEQSVPTMTVMVILMVHPVLVAAM